MNTSYPEPKLMTESTVKHFRFIGWDMIFSYYHAKASHRYVIEGNRCLLQIKNAQVMVDLTAAHPMLKEGFVAPEVEVDLVFGKAVITVTKEDRSKYMELDVEGVKIYICINSCTFSYGSAQ